ncbi:MAG: MBL fold metallo-hydrolase [Pirellulales bacterium]
MSFGFKQLASVAIAALLIGVVAVSGAKGWLAPEDTTITEVAPGVFFRKAQTAPTFTGCNQGWIEFKDFVLVIDANFPGQVEHLVKAVREKTQKPIKFVFDTHHHGDHADGNVHFVKLGAVAIANERSRPLFETTGLDGFEGSKKTRAAEYSELKYEMPSLYFDRKFVFDDGTQRVELMYLGHGHTAGDAVAWLPRHGILFTGDACVNGAFNYTGESNTESWISVLTQMADLPVKKVCPGHGEMGDKTVIESQRRYFVELRAAIGKLIDAGKSLDQIKSELDLPFYQAWTGVDVKKQAENIEHVYGELKKKS